MLAPLVGFATGLTLAAPPGPMNAIIAREASEHGIGAGIRAGMGAPVADVVFLAAVLLGLESAQSKPWFGTALDVAALFGGCFLLYLAWSTARATPKRGKPRSFWAGFTVAFTNPYQIGWWLSGGVALVADQGLGFFFGFLAGIFGWVVAFSYLMRKGSQRYDSLVPVVQVLSADLLFVFAFVVFATI